MWQDQVLLAASFVFAITLLPTLKNKEAKVPRWSSIPTALALYVMTYTYFTLDLYLGTTGTFLTGIMWTLIAIYRY